MHAKSLHTACRPGVSHCAYAGSQGPRCTSYNAACYQLLLHMPRVPLVLHTVPPVRLIQLPLANFQSVIVTGHKRHIVGCKLVCVHQQAHNKAAEAVSSPHGVHLEIAEYGKLSSFHWVPNSPFARSNDDAVAVDVVFGELHAEYLHAHAA